MKRRAYRGRPATTADIGGAVLVLLAGLIWGAISKYADQFSPFWAEVTSHIAMWILLASVLALNSRGPGWAALHTLLFLGGMVAAYYTTAALLGSVWSKDYLIGWGIAALLSPIPGWLVWYARGDEWYAWLLSAGVVIAQIAASLFLFGKLGVADAVVVVLTAVVLFYGKVRNSLKTGYRRRGR